MDLDPQAVDGGGPIDLALPIPEHEDQLIPRRGWGAEGAAAADAKGTAIAPAGCPWPGRRRHRATAPTAPVHRHGPDPATPDSPRSSRGSLLPCPNEAGLLRDGVDRDEPLANPIPRAEWFKRAGTKGGTTKVQGQSRNAGPGFPARRGPSRRPGRPRAPRMQQHRIQRHASNREPPCLAADPLSAIVQKSCAHRGAERGSDRRLARPGAKAAGGSPCATKQQRQGMTRG